MCHPIVILDSWLFNTMTGLFNEILTAFLTLLCQKNLSGAWEFILSFIVKELFLFTCLFWLFLQLWSEGNFSGILFGVLWFFCCHGRYIIEFAVMIAFWNFNSFLSCKYFPAGKVMLKLGKVQFELQKLVDSYVSPFSPISLVCLGYTSIYW